MHLQEIVNAVFDDANSVNNIENLLKFFVNMTVTYPYFKNELLQRINRPVIYILARFLPLEPR